MNDNTINGAAPTATRAYRPELALFHPSASGKGAAVKFRVLPAKPDAEGCIMMTIAAQKTIGDRNAQGVARYASFDWERKICVKLGFTDLVAFLQVFRGELETINEDKGLYHRSPAGMTHIALKHMVEPTPSYALFVDRRPADGAEQQSVRITLSSGEALGLMVAIEQSLGLVCFGVPGALEPPAGAGVSATPPAGAPYEIAQGVRDAFAA